YKHLEFEFSFSDIASGLVLLECEEDLKQRTGFLLEDNSIVTCAHVVCSQTKAINPQTQKKFDIEIIAQESTLDLALLKFSDPSTVSFFQPLLTDTADNLEIGFPVIISGFPNFRPGDSGVFKEGKIVGFRMASGIRRLLID